MKLIDLMYGIDFNNIELTEDIKNMKIESISYNSRYSKENDVFVCIKGETVDGHKYAKNAYEKGCRVFLVQDLIDLPEDAIILQVENTRIGLSKISANFFDNPSKKLKVIGVTGTKGKTTITNYISTVLNDSGINTGTIGTNGIFYNGKYEKTVNTTPESYELQKTIRRMLDEGVQCVCMEVSSGGIMMNRVNDIDFDLAIFTNLSEDHVGPKEHPSFEHYMECKAKLFTMAKYGIINVDDDYAHIMIEKATCPVTTFSIKKEADVMAKNIEYSRNVTSLGINFDCKTPDSVFKTYITSPGTFSVYNALAVIAVCRHLNINNKRMLESLKIAKVKGRVEVLPALPYATVIIDYAHNGVSLENILQTLKQYEHNRLICLFGSVGGRTKGRRKELGDVASRECDLCILTSDNPDFEEPIEVIKDIADSFKGSDCEYIVEIDRKVAIEKAMHLLQDGDMLVLAGKGHEEYQLIKGERIPFSEAEIVVNTANEILANHKQNLSS